MSAAILAEKARRSGSRDFASFVKQAWQYVDSAPLVWNWHLDAIAVHLEALAAGRIRQLVINIPPGFGKSKLVSVLYPVWRWALNPRWQAICASYSSELAARDSDYRLQLMRSSWFRQTYASQWSLRKTRGDYITNNYFGHMIAIGIGGAGTGRRGDAVIIDDPHNAQDVYSKTARDQAKQFHDQTASTRFNDAQTGETLIIMQVLHEDDLTGHVLEQGGYTHLRLPMRFEAADRCVTHDKDGNELYRDPRTTEGELLFPQKWPEVEVAKLEKKLGHAAPGQLQQRAAPAGGGMFKRADWRFWKPDGAAPEHNHPRPRDCYTGPANAFSRSMLEEVLISVDATFRKTVAGSYVAIHVWGSIGSRRLLLDRRHDRWDFADTVKQLLQVIALWPEAIRKLVEGKANGDAIISQLTTEHGIAGIEAIEPGTSSKEQRANAAQPFQAAGNVELPDGAPWLEEYVGEHAAFPKGRYNDDVDAQSQALLALGARPRTAADAYEELFDDLPPGW